MGSFIDISGKTFGRLTVIKPLSERRSNQVVWMCLCTCGNIKNIIGRSLRVGATASCGCMIKEKSAQRCIAASIHGLSNTPIGRSWYSMIGRCFNKKIPPYRKYGMRGITVCRYIRSSPVNLMRLIGNRPLGKTLDRIKGEGHYSCGKCEDCKKNHWNLNVKWSTPKSQARHMTRNLWLDINGITKCVTDWSIETGIPISTISYRHRVGYSGIDLICERVHS